jgi:Flp pilus assembly protein TadG
MLEFALASAVLIPVLTSIFQLGYSMYIYNRMEIAIRQAGRYAALRTYDSGTSTPSSGYVTGVRNMAAYANPNAGTSLLIPSLTPDLVSVTVSWLNGTPDTVTVSVTSFRIDAAIATITVTGKPSATYKYQGRFSPP